MPRTINHSPSPKSHIKTLMKIGYDFNSAVSDILDNSIAAGAKNIQILSTPGVENPSISIIDDGVGMTSEELIENMRLGCKDPSADRDPGDLGRFGSGMKTASFSQARQLTVVSKAQGADLVAARWDIDEIERTDTWCLEVFEGQEANDLIGESIYDIPDRGTQIIWGKLSSIEDIDSDQSKADELAAKLAELRGYIGLHFHNFISGRNKVTIKLNGSVVNPVDPFMSKCDGYQEGRTASIETKAGTIEIKTHVLPHFKRMPKKKLEELGGAQEISQKQGLYIYREKRLISSGGWHGLARNSQLSALARVQVDIPSSLDHEWSTDVKKSSLQMPLRVRKEIRKFLSDPKKKSKRIHVYKGKQEEANKFWKMREDENTNAISYEIDPENQVLMDLLKSGDDESTRALIKYLKGLAENLPINHIYEKMSDRPRDVNQTEVDMSEVEALVAAVMRDI